MWKLAARRTIAEYLKERLAKAVADGWVVVVMQRISPLRGA